MNYALLTSPRKILKLLLQQPLNNEHFIAML